MTPVLKVGRRDSAAPPFPPFVMPGLDPGISRRRHKTLGSSPRVTRLEEAAAYPQPKIQRAAQYGDKILPVNLEKRKSGKMLGRGMMQPRAIPPAGTRSFR
jgi:hypothetical protein